MTCENWQPIFEDLVRGTKEGHFDYLEGDCPLEDTVDHICNETRFSVIQNFRCECGSRVEWGVCIRGTPLLKVHKH